MCVRGSIKRRGSLRMKIKMRKMISLIISKKRTKRQEKSLRKGKEIGKLMRSN